PSDPSLTKSSPTATARGSRSSPSAAKPNSTRSPSGSYGRPGSSNQSSSGAGLLHDRAGRLHRIGEARGLVWDAVDLEAGTVEVRGTVIRVTGEGVMIKPRTKSKAGWRMVTLP